MESKKKYYGNLNILKFIGAVIIACFLHYENHFLIQVRGGYWAFGDFGSTAIQFGSYVTELFFLISGFLFFENSYSDIKKGMSFDRFIWTRIKRLWPLAVVTILVAYCLKLAQLIIVRTNFPWFRLSLTDLLLDLVLGSKILWNGVGVNGPVWYITVLFICVIVAYFLARTSSLFAFFFPFATGVVLYEYRETIPVAIQNTSRGLIAFFCGVLLCIFIRKVRLTSSFKIICGAIFLAGIFILCIDTAGVLITNYPIYGCLVLYPEIIIASDTDFIHRIGNSKIGKWMSKVSFHIYLWNFPLISLMVIIVGKIGMEYETVKYVLWPIFVVFQLVIAAISLAIYESVSELIKSKKRFRVENKQV